MNSHPFYLTPATARDLLAQSIARRAMVLNTRAQRQALFMHHLTLPEARRLGAAAAATFVLPRLWTVSPAVALKAYRLTLPLIA